MSIMCFRNQVPLCDIQITPVGRQRGDEREFYGIVMVESWSHDFSSRTKSFNISSNNERYSKLIVEILSDG